MRTLRSDRSSIFLTAGALTPAFDLRHSTPSGPVPVCHHKQSAAVAELADALG